jgi:septum formation protein
MPEQIILASASPRRKELLEKLGFQVKTMPSNIPEDMFAEELPENFVKRISREKVLAVVERLKTTVLPEDYKSLPYTHSGAIEKFTSVRWIVGGDTVVVVDDEILGKPKDGEQGMHMLERLSGREHLVITGFCVYDLTKNKEGIQAVTSIVRFKHLRRREIEKYISLGESLDMAGSYGIQGVGAYLVDAISGSYTNIVGLPLCQVVEMMQEMGADDVLPF